MTNFLTCFILLNLAFLPPQGQGFWNGLAQNDPSEITNPQGNEDQQNTFNNSLDNLPLESPQQPPAADAYAVIFRAYDRATLSAQVTTTIKKIYYRMGQAFHKNDLLILLDDTVFQGLVYKAKGSLNKANAELKSKNQLFQEDIASVFELKTAEANVAIATSDLISAEHALNACHILAPYNGKIVQLFVDEAELIQEGKPLIEIVNDDQVIGQILLPANVFILKNLTLGKSLKIAVKETEKSVVGKILRISPIIDPASSLIKIDILIDNKDGELRPGMIGSTTFINDLNDNENSSIKEEPMKR